MVRKYKSIICERKGPKEEVLWITLNDEKKMNALSDVMQQELLSVLEDAAYDNEIRCVVLKGAGDKAFCSGGDINVFQSLDTVSAYDFSYNRGNRTQHLMNYMEKPVIAAVNGYCFAGGMELALSCDFIYASSSAKFGLLEINLGLLPGWGGTVRLPRKIPVNRAKEMIYRGEITAIPGEHVVPELYGQSVLDSPSGETVQPVSDDVTTARDIFKTIDIRVIRYRH